MESRILVPLDGSSLAEQALSPAVTLARGLPAELLLFHATWIPPDVVAILDKANLEAVVNQLEGEAAGYLDSLIDQMSTAGLDVHSIVQHGPAAEAILDYAEGADIDQIVMATHGYGGIKRWTHGSVTERVLHAVRVPLLLVRSSDQEPAPDWQHPMICRRILVPLDGSPVAEQILPVATRVARAQGAQLVLFQVPATHISAWWVTGEWYPPVEIIYEVAEQDARAYLSRVAGRLQEQGLDVSTDISSGGVADRIVDYAETNQIDLIAMCTHGRTGVARWTLGSVADRVLRTGTTPILLVRMR
jgi:nucleotide-binding universal stress UspA family protein